MARFYTRASWVLTKMAGSLDFLPIAVTMMSLEKELVGNKCVISIKQVKAKGIKCIIYTFNCDGA